MIATCRIGVGSISLGKHGQSENKKLDFKLNHKISKVHFVCLLFVIDNNPVEQMNKQAEVGVVSDRTDADRKGKSVLTVVLLLSYRIPCHSISGRDRQ